MGVIHLHNAMHNGRYNALHRGRKDVASVIQMTINLPAILRGRRVKFATFI